MDEPHVYNWNSRNILVVEDDESSVFLLDLILKNTGAKVEFISDGRMAVEYIRDHPDTDLILMDLHLPEKDGLTATKEIKEISGNVVVIAQTAFAYSMDHSEAQEAGCDAFLTKPLNPGQLLQMMDTYLC